MTSADARVVRSARDFWLATCGIDTHARGPGNAQNDTPWVAFTADRRRLVCTVWDDQVAEVYDPVVGRYRRFVVLGGSSSFWLKGAKKRGLAAKEAIAHALREKLPVYGFEIVAAGSQPGAVTRRIDRLHLDRVYLLKPHIGGSALDTRERLNLDKILADAWKSPDIDALKNGTLFELSDPAGDIPAADWVAPSPNGASLQGALKALPYLVEHVRLQKDGVLNPLTYSDLALYIGRLKPDGSPMALGMGEVLGVVVELIHNATADWPVESRPPHITTIVVLKSGRDAGLPDDGVKGFWPGFELMTAAEKRAKINDEYFRILAYGDLWLKVLESVGLSPLLQPNENGDSSGGVPWGGWGGGESDAHKDLRHHVLRNPQLLGVVNPKFSATEHPLLSGDKLDAFFRTEDVWVGVEVKSLLSGDQDLERGIYQAVKYRAVLEAQALTNAEASSPDVKVVLVIQRPLPANLERDAKTLGVTWMVLPPEAVSLTSPSQPTSAA